MLNNEFIHPKFFPTWILILLMRAGVFIPFKIQVLIGKVIGRLLYLFMHKLRSTAYSNISHCFPDKKQTQVNLLVKKHFEAIGISFFETANAYYGSDHKISKLLTISNEQLFNDALKEDINGVLHITGDKKLSMFELAKLTTPDIKPMTLEDYSGPHVTINMTLDSINWKKYKISKF